jgi:hypothetical protein
MASTCGRALVLVSMRVHSSSRGRSDDRNTTRTSSVMAMQSRSSAGTAADCSWALMKSSTWPEKDGSKRISRHMFW